MNDKKITAILMDVQPVERKMRIRETNANLSSRVFNKPLLDHHIEALGAQGIHRHIILSERDTAATFHSTGATFKDGVSFKEFLKLQDLDNEFYIFLPANVYLHLDIQYFLSTHVESGQAISRVSPLGEIKNRSLSYFDPVILNHAVMAELFTQVSRLTIDTLRVYLNQQSKAQRIPTHLITSTLSSPAQVWKLHQKLHQLGVSKTAPVGYPYQENLWAGLDASIHEDCQVEDLVIAGQNVVIKENVKLKGLVVLGDNVVIENGAVIENSIIENDTYVGKMIYIENSVVRGNRLYRIDRGITLDIPEKQILGKSNLVSRLFKRSIPRTRTNETSWEVVSA
jgi:hypothetical protein